ncbi:hypothetical protein FXF65_07095 [Actinomadura syzygii]|uniref:UspA domain-containing protein n=1 Tax=Actinomadura syzygii TaxID=1427538 RepID=A0A5D0UEA6_9ACTN|nr:hypothetical protein FXF65_07095 [Actinomadura syzygii]
MKAGEDRRARTRRWRSGQGGYPHVQVTTSLVLKSPREALFEAAEDATLAVVGARDTGVVERLTLGATSDALLKHAPCTVAVVPQRFGPPLGRGLLETWTEDESDEHRGGNDLKREPFLKDMRTPDLTRLATAARFTGVPAGRGLFAERTPAERFWLLHEGWTRLWPGGSGLSGGHLVALEGAAHAAGAAAAAAEFAAGDGDDLDVVVAEHGVGGDVAFVGEDDAGFDGKDVVAVVPLLAFGGADVLLGGEEVDAG